MLNYEIYRIVKSMVDEFLKENHKESTTETYLTVEEAASELNIKVSRVRAAIFRREIPFVKIGQLVRIPKAKLHEYLQTNLTLPNNTGLC